MRHGATKMGDAKQNGDIIPPQKKKTTMLRSYKDNRIKTCKSNKKKTIFRTGEITIRMSMVSAVISYYADESIYS